MYADAAMVVGTILQGRECDASVRLPPACLIVGLVFFRPGKQSAMAQASSFRNFRGRDENPLLLEFPL